MLQPVEAAGVAAGFAAFFDFLAFFALGAAFFATFLAAFFATFFTAFLAAFGAAFFAAFFTAFLTAFFAALGAALAFAAFLAAGFAAFTAFLATFFTAFFAAFLGAAGTTAATAATAAFFATFFFLATAICFTSSNSPGVDRLDTYSVPDSRGFVKRSSHMTIRGGGAAAKDSPRGGARLGGWGRWGVGLARRQVDSRQHAADRAAGSLNGRDADCQNAGRGFNGSDLVGAKGGVGPR